MYDRARAARNRVLSAADAATPLGRAYRELANLLALTPDSPRKTAALKKLADSCDSAAGLMEKTIQSGPNVCIRPGPPGETNG